jgi:hypothetical protein
VRNLKRRKIFDDFGTESLASFMDLSLIQRKVALRILPYLQGLTELHFVNSSMLLLCWRYEIVEIIPNRIPMDAITMLK